eukprot:scaffold12999_cov112-Isochrysis_galbana.AAC.4
MPSRRWMRERTRGSEKGGRMSGVRVVEKMRGGESERERETGERREGKERERHACHMSQHVSPYSIACGQAGGSAFDLGIRPE